MSFQSLRPNLWIYLATTVVTILLSACASTGQQVDYRERAESQLASISQWPDAKGEPVPGVSQLNDLINSEPLAALVNESLQNNPGLQQTFLALQSAKVALKSTHAAELPSAEASFDAGRNENASDTQYTGFVSVSWQLDIWAQQADATAAARKDVTSARLLYQSARDTLAASVMSAWLTQIYLQRTLAIENQRLNTFEVNEGVVLQRYRKGLGSLEDLDSIRSSAASSRATVERYKEDLARQQRTLRTLLGRLGSNEGEKAVATAGSANAELNSIPENYPNVLQPLVELPELSLQRRPDLQAAYTAIVAEQLRTSVAYKDLLPSIKLQAFLTDVATKPAEALLTDPVWGLLGQLTAPLYQGGALRAAIDQQQITTASAYESYRENLLTAVEEVANALSQEQSLAKQQAHIETALKSSQNNVKQYTQKYRTGAANIIELLLVERSNYDLQNQLDTLIYNRLNNRITLALALGLSLGETV